MRTQTPSKPVLFASALRTIVLGVFAVTLCLLTCSLLAPAHTVAATSAAINFQARLETASGAIAPDGNYNVEFKLYSASSGGVAEWTEDYLNNNSQGVHVVNGYLTVNLGSITSFPGTINWNQQQWLTMNIGNTNLTCTPFSSCVPDGEMSPRLLLTATPYAFQAGTLGTTNGANVATLSFTTPTATDSILLPDASGTVCLQNATACGFAPATGGTGYVQLQSSTPGTTQTGHFNISGTGIAGTLQASTFDTASAVALALGNTNATAINLGKTGSNILTTVNGTALIKPTSGNDSTTAFQVQNSSSKNLFTVDTANTAIVLGNDGTPSALDVRGGAATGANVTGSNLTFDASNGTGSGGSGDFIFRTALSNQAVKLDAISNSGNAGSVSTLTWNHTVTASQSNTMLVVELIADNTTTWSNVKYGTQTLTQLGSTLTCGGASPDFATRCHMDIWYLLNPATGTHAITATPSTAQDASGGAASFYNVNQSTPFGTESTTVNTTATCTNTNESLSSATAANQLLLGVFGSDNSSTFGTGTHLWNDQFVWSALGTTKPGTGGSVSIDWNTNCADFAIALVPINPVSTSTADTLTDQLHIQASTGNVGISQSNPQYTLDVNGTGNFATAVQTPALQSAAATALTITGNAASTWSTSAGNITLQAGGGTISFGTTANLTSTNALTLTGGSTLTLNSTTTNAVTLDSGTTGTVNVGNGGSSKTIQVGATNSAITDTIAIGNNSNASGISLITLGSSSNASSTLTLEAGTAASAIQIGNGATAHGIQIGAGAAVQTVTIGSTNTTSATTIQAGSSGISLVGDASDLFSSSIGLVQTSATATNATNPHWVAVEGKYAYVVESGGTQTLEIFDITQPSAPVSVGTLALNQPSPAQIQVQGKYAYIAEQGTGNAGRFQIVDVSNPHAPTSVAVISLGTNTGPFGLYVQGRYAYVVNSATATLSIVDISNVANPVAVSTTTVNTSPRKVYVQGRYAYVASFGGTPELQVLDVGNPTSPSIVGTATLSGSLGGDDVTVQGRYAYVTKYGAGLQVFNVSNPASPTSVFAGGGSYYAYANVLAGRYLISDGYNYANNLAITDVSNPSSPVMLQTYTTNLSEPGGMAVSGRYLFVANQTGNNLIVLDLSGLETTAATIHSLEAGALTVDDNAAFGGDISLQGGLTIGGNAQLNGNLGVSGWAVFSNSTNSTTAFQVQNASGSSVLTVDTSNLVVTVAGTSSSFGSLTVTNAHISSTQTTAPTIGTPTNCGTGPASSVAASSTDSAGSFSITTGNPIGTTCDTAITFNKAYGTAPKSIIVVAETQDGGTGTAAARQIYVSASATTGFTVKFNNGATAGTAEVDWFYYWVVQ